MLDIQHYYKKLANNEPIGEDETVALLKELAHFREAAAYLASCQAATLEGLPKSTSKSSRARHEALCLTAAKLIDGDRAAIRYPVNPIAAKERCLSAASKVRPLLK